jgi:hypothetical protein
MSSQRGPMGVAGAPFGPRCGWRRLRRRQGPPAAGFALGPQTRQAAQRRGLPRRLLLTGPRSFRPAGASLRKQSWSGRPPPSLPAPEQSPVPDGPREWVAGHLFRSPSRFDSGFGTGRGQMTSTSSTASSTASATSSSHTPEGRAEPTAASQPGQRDAAEAARAAKIAALHDQISEHGATTALSSRSSVEVRGMGAISTATAVVTVPACDLRERRASGAPKGIGDALSCGFRQSSEQVPLPY